jgi:sarcosine oxidase subunit gamma
VLAGGCSVEVDPGRCAQTLLARAQVILYRPKPDRWRILVRPSFAPYLRAWLEDALTTEA